MEEAPAVQEAGAPEEAEAKVGVEVEVEQAVREAEARVGGEPAARAAAAWVGVG